MVESIEKDKTYIIQTAPICAPHVRGLRCTPAKDKFGVPIVSRIDANSRLMNFVTRQGEALFFAPGDLSHDTEQPTAD